MYDPVDSFPLDSELPLVEEVIGSCDASLNGVLDWDEPGVSVNSLDGGEDVLEIGAWDRLGCSSP